jgi:hypothetical protein
MIWILAKSFLVQLLMFNNWMLLRSTCNDITFTHKRWKLILYFIFIKKLITFLYINNLSFFFFAYFWVKILNFLSICIYKAIICRSLSSIIITYTLFITLWILLHRQSFVFVSNCVGTPTMRRFLMSFEDKLSLSVELIDQ